MPTNVKVQTTVHKHATTLLVAIRAVVLLDTHLQLMDIHAMILTDVLVTRVKHREILELAVRIFLLLLFHINVAVLLDISILLLLVIAARFATEIPLGVHYGQVVRFVLQKINVKQMAPNVQVVVHTTPTLLPVTH